MAASPPLPSAVTIGQSRARREQLLALALAAVLLLFILLLQPALTARRDAIINTPSADPRRSAEANATARQLAVEFPRLTLGGFRGLLAERLWAAAEDDKNERRWVELETKYNYIGQLEPYFVTVYIFNAWNEAYNLSAQWHGVDEKFKWVIDGLEHLYTGEANNPGNPDILLEEAQMYFLKLGGSFERIEYRRMWRDRIRHLYLLEAPEAKVARAFETHRKVRDIVLRPEFHATPLPKDDQHPNQIGYGISITGLIPDQPNQAVEFRYGLSPFAFAYLEYKRLQATKLHPTTTGYQVVDGYGGMSLRLWCRDDLYYANSLTAEMFQDGAPTAEIPDFGAKVFEIRDCYRNVQMNGPHSLQEFAEHLERFPNNKYIHHKHMIEDEFMLAIGQAESRMFEGLVAWQEHHRQFDPREPAAQQHLSASLVLYGQAIAAIQKYIDEILPNQGTYVNPDRADYVKLQTAMQTRIAGIQALLAAKPNTPVDLSFLQPAPVER